MNNENNDTCPICINEFQKNNNGDKINFAVTSCGHTFCLNCIVRHSISKYTCPLCRQDLVSYLQKRCLIFIR